MTRTLISISRGELQACSDYVAIMLHAGYNTKAPGSSTPSDSLSHLLAYLNGDLAPGANHRTQQAVARSLLSALFYGSIEML